MLPAFEREGCKVWHFVFDGGDFLETPRRFAMRFPDKGAKWAAFVRLFIGANTIDTIVVFNDCLPKQAAALRIGEQLVLHTFAFENGYFRPNWITFEKQGIDARSRNAGGLPRSQGRVPSVFWAVGATPHAEPSPPHNTAVIPPST